MLLMAVKNRLQTWLDELGLNYSQAAEKTGVHVQTIRRIAKNQSERLDVSTVGAICRGLKRPVGDFLYEDEEK